MVKRIGFWREVQNSYGSTYHAMLKTFTAPDEISDAQAIEVATREFCAWAHVDHWDDIANGYEVQHHVDEHRPPVRDGAAAYWFPTTAH